jgi:L-threonylcarbamoyladenylate synthase
MSTCTIYPINDANILKCSENISNGNVVIFPTETVYGIGASALNLDAIQKIYQIKNRPGNNPLIMHILNWQGGIIYTKLNPLETSIVESLTNTFWPGPLTILVKKSSYVLDAISANTDWVALRSPKHPVIRKLIEKSMVPIVAPSANISGKITSTYKDHVLKYFKHTDVSVIIDENPSTIGIESTIVKINNNQIDIVRPGLITKEDIQTCLKTIPNITISHVHISSQAEYPGSNISHYTTDKKTLMFNFISYNTLNNSSDEITQSIKNVTKEYLNQSAIIDFNKKNQQYYDYFAAHVDLSESGDLNEALFNLYNILHQLNTIDIKNILIFDFWSSKDGLYKTIYDRLYRCANGQHTLIPLEYFN